MTMPAPATAPGPGPRAAGAGELPLLSVVLITPDAFETIGCTVRHLAAQTIANRLELLVAAPASAQVEIPARAVSALAGCRLVPIDHWTTLSAAKAAAVRVATAPVIAFAEDHSFPEPEWAAALVAAHARGFSAVGAQMLNANPGSLLSWAAMFLHFGAAVQPAEGQEVRYTSASHNTSYSRDALLALGDRLPRLMQAELFLQDALRERGLRLYSEPGARTRHVNVTHLRPWLLHGAVGGRMYGALRMELEGWPLHRRLLYIAGSPLIPLLRFGRAMHDIRRTSHRRALLPGVLPAVAAGLVANALGEVSGYLFGIGDSERRYSGFEVRRWDLVNERDRAAWS